MLLPLAALVLGCADAPTTPAPTPTPEATGPWSRSRLLHARDSALGTSGPFGRLVVDGAHAYLPSMRPSSEKDRAANGILKVPLGGGETTVLAEGGDSAVGEALAVDGEHLYWTSAQGISRVPLAGGPSEVVVPGGGDPKIRPDELVVDGDQLFWIEWTGEKSPTQPLRSAPKGGGPVVTVTPPQHGANGLCVDGDVVYFTTPQGIRRVPRTGGTPAPLPNAPEGTTVRLVHDADALYTIRLHSGRTSLVKIPKDGSPAEELAAGPLWTADLALDPTHVYFVDDGGDRTVRLRRVPKAGGVAETVDSGPSTGALRHLAVHDGQVVFVDREGVRTVPAAPAATADPASAPPTP